MSGISEIEEHIQRLKDGGSLTENEVKNLCEKVSYPMISV